MVGSSCWRKLKDKGYKNLIGKRSSELDLTNQESVRFFFEKEKPDFVIDAAAKVGGIIANNDFPYEFLLNNMLIQNNLIQNSHNYDVKKFIFLGSSCIYPKLSKQPIKEEYLLTGNLEPTNEAYAIAKISGLKLCESLRNQYKKNFLSLMPTNLYGPNDNFDKISSHVIPAMIRKFHDAKEFKLNSVKLWGTGNPRREFLHVDDLANAIIYCIENNVDETIYNVGYGSDITIKELAYMVKDIIGFKGKILWDSEKPDGTPRKLIDSSKIRKHGWLPKINLLNGLDSTYRWFLKNKFKC